MTLSEALDKVEQLRKSGEDHALEYTIYTIDGEYYTLNIYDLQLNRKEENNN